MEWVVTYPEDGIARPFYEGWLARAGIASRLVSPGSTIPPDLSVFGGLVLPGGADVEPCRYGETVIHPATYGLSRERDDLEFRMLKAFSAMRKPVFGICRGLQVLSVARGGSLIQHIPDFLSGKAEETHRVKDSYDVFHPLTVDSASRLGRALETTADTNSAHHQAVCPDRVGQGLRVIARSGAGIVEAIESCDAAERIAAVQWHPERLPPDHPASAALLEFVRYGL